MAASKTIALEESTYNRLKARKREGETFNDVIDRLAGERSLLEIVGTGEPGDGFAEAVEEASASLDRGADTVTRQLNNDSEDREE